MIASRVRGEGQSPILTNLDGDIRGPNAGSKAQESGNDGRETHVSEREEKERR